MRLSEISEIIKSSIGRIQAPFISQKSIVIGSATYFRAGNLILYRSAIKDLEATDLFQNIITKIKRFAVFSVAEDEVDLKQADYSNLVSLTKQLESVAKEVYKAIDNALPQETEVENKISVKLPNFQTFDEFIEILRILEKAFEQAVLNDAVDGYVIIDGLEPGSRWINIKVGTQAAALLIGALVYAGTAVSNQMNTNAHVEQDLRAKELRNEALEAVVEANKRQIDLFIETQAKQVQDEKVKGDNEQLEKLKLSIKSFADIINMGGEIHPALNAPKEVKSEFPDNVSKYLIEPKTKKIDKE